MFPPEHEIWLVDTEWTFRFGRIDWESAYEPVVFCAVGLRSGRRRSFFGRSRALARFIDKHQTDTFVAHNAVAEMKFLLRQGIVLPDKWFDTYLAYRYITNAPNPPKAGLPYMCSGLGIPFIPPTAKQEMQQRILNLKFNPRSLTDLREIRDYCFLDCDAPISAYKILVDQIDPQIMAWWVEYLKAIARMELRGIPMDVPVCRMLSESRTNIRDELIREVNQVRHLFRRGSFRRKSFFNWCKQETIDWPITRSKSGRSIKSLDSDTFELMEYRHPFIKQVKECRSTIRQLTVSPLKVDVETGRHYFSTNHFRSVTSRNQPTNFLFAAAKWFRYLAVPESPDHVLVSVDFKAQEVGLASALAGDPALWSSYLSPDPHIDFAIRAGAAPPGSTKESHRDIRNQHKSVNLGVLYGQTAWGISHRLGINLYEAQRLIDQHKTIYAKYWEWSESVVDTAFEKGIIRTPCLWQSKVPPGSNHRTFMNFPIQASGADVMRLTTIYLDRQEVKLMAIIHDGFLMSCHRDEIETLRSAVDLAVIKASQHVIPGYMLDYDFVVHARRYRDKDGHNVWRKVRRTILKYNRNAATKFRNPWFVAPMADPGSRPETRPETGF